MPEASELAELDCVAQAELVRRGEVSPAELVAAAIARTEKVNPVVNAVIHQLYEKAVAQAAAPERLPAGRFRGVPIMLKDLTAHSAGDPFHAGGRFLRDLDFRHPQDANQTLRLRQAGFIFIGRTNTPELGLVGTTEPLAYGPTRNPWNLERSAGGSSGGSAAAVAAGMVAAAHATDGGGSIRIPASMCGLVGLKPSRGRISLGPGAAESPAGLSTGLVVSRSVRDTAAILDVMQGWMAGDPYSAPTPARPYVDELSIPPGRLRIGFMIDSAEGFPASAPACAEAVRGAAHQLEALGHVVSEAHPPALEQPGALRDFRDFWPLFALYGIRGWEDLTGRKVSEADVEPMTWALAEMSRSLTAIEFLAFRSRFNTFTRKMAEWWSPEGEFDLLLTPTIATPPPPLGSLNPPGGDPIEGYNRLWNYVLFTPQYNATGQPAISLPLHWDQDGLPIGVQLVAAYGREDLLIRVAAQLEEASPWAGRRPAVWAG